MNRRFIKHTALFVLLIAVFTVNSQAQNERKFIRNGNDLFEHALSDTTKLDTTTFSLAETEYRKALDKRPDDLKWKFNLGDALYKQKKFEEAAAGFGEIIDKSEDKIEKAQSYHNLGNSLLMQNKLDESIDAYKDALRNNPTDLESKYNLAYAMNLKKKQEEQQKQQQQNQNQNKDKDQDKDKDKDKNQDQNKDQQNKDQNKDQDQQKQDQNQNKDKQDQDQKQQPQQQKISKENAERLLKALQNDEQKIQEKVKKAKAEKAKQRQTDKDW